MSVSQQFLPEDKRLLTRRNVLDRITESPTRYSDFAERGADERPQLRKIVDKLLATGTIRQVYLDRFPYYVAADWELFDDQRLQLILNRCKPVNGCMVWTGFTDANRGPMVRLPDESPKAARRAVWELRRGPLGYQQTVRASDTCESGCLEFTHLKRGRREDFAKGRNITLLQRHRIAQAFQQRRAKLNWEKVRAIRASQEPDAVQAERHGVSKATIIQVRRQVTWQEFGGVFTSLIESGRAAA